MKNYTSLAMGTTTFTDSSVTAGVTYDYQVKYTPNLVSSLVSIKLSPSTCKPSTVTASTFPTANHPIDLGYYYADGRYGNYSSEVFGFTNTSIVGPEMYVSDATWGNSTPSKNIEILFRASIKEAYDAGKTIYLYPGTEDEWDRTLAVAAPYWSRVKYVEMTHEDPRIDRATTENMTTRFIGKLNSRGLRRPLFVALESPQAETAPSIDCVAIEAYMPLPFDQNNTASAVATMNSVVQARKNSVLPGKCIIMVMQAYDRNGYWMNMESLKKLQEPAYLHAYNDPRVLAITMFAYARPGGAKDHPELKAIHKEISKAITSGTGGVFPPFKM